jgi:hypothetical protein
MTFRGRRRTRRRAALFCENIENPCKGQSESRSEAPRGGRNCYFSMNIFGIGLR